MPEAKTTTERAILNAYRALDEADKEKVIAYAKSLLGEEKPEDVVKELRGRIYAKYGNIMRFSKEMGYKEHTPITRRLNGVTGWGLAELWRMKELLGIPDGEFSRYNDALNAVREAWIAKRK